jgi:SAM-dependent methyltransferase
MKNIDTKLLKKYIDGFLENRPAFFSLIRSQEAYLFTKLDEYIKGKILDFGAGDGYFADLIWDKKKIDVGLDISSSRIEEAKSVNVYKTLKVYDGDTIPFKTNTFDSVISNCVLEHIPGIQNSVNEICRVTKPKGYFLTGVMTNNWERFQFGPQFFGNYYKKKMRKQQEHFNLFTVGKWDSVFEKAGFKIVKRIGYISPLNAKWLDIYHYLSLPSLITYKLTKNWVLWKKWYSIIPLDKLALKLTKESLEENNVKNSSAVFYVVQKK